MCMHDGIRIQFDATRTQHIRAACPQKSLQHQYALILMLNDRSGRSISWLVCRKMILQEGVIIPQSRPLQLAWNAKLAHSQSVQPAITSGSHAHDSNDQHACQGHNTLAEAVHVAPCILLKVGCNCHA